MSNGEFQVNHKGAYRNPSKKWDERGGRENRCRSTLEVRLTRFKDPFDEGEDDMKVSSESVESQAFQPGKK